MAIYINGVQQPESWTGGVVPVPGSGGVTHRYTYTMPPAECSGDVHVFGCSHCETCKCGKAKVERARGGVLPAGVSYRV